jgi:hypothetical protein
MSARQHAEERAAARSGVAPGRLPGIDVDYGTEMADVVRTALADATSGVPEHTRHRGADSSQCPRCELAATIAQRAATSFAGLVDKRGLRSDGALATVRCLDCQDSGQVTVSEDPFIARPCEACNPDGYARWADGHRAPGHDCEACRELIRAR